MGYLIVDHRGGGGKLEEADTVACKHCRRAIRIRRRAFAATQTETGLYCMRCAGPICEPCGAAAQAPAAPHQSFEAVVDEALRRQALAQAMGLQGG